MKHALIKAIYMEVIGDMPEQSFHITVSLFLAPSPFHMFP